MNKRKSNKKEEYLSEIFISGNNDANNVHITKIDSNKIHLKVGDCCVYTIDCIITAEALSNFLTQIHLLENKSFLELVRSKMGWTEEINDEFFKGCADKPYSIFK